MCVKGANVCWKNCANKTKLHGMTNNARLVESAFILAIGVSWRAWLGWRFSCRLLAQTVCLCSQTQLLGVNTDHLLRITMILVRTCAHKHAQNTLQHSKLSFLKVIFSWEELDICWHHFRLLLCWISWPLTSMYPHRHSGFRVWFKINTEWDFVSCCFRSCFLLKV